MLNYSNATTVSLVTELDIAFRELKGQTNNLMRSLLEEKIEELEAELYRRNLHGYTFA